jgi:anti-anti-sigma factor
MDVFIGKTNIYMDFKDLKFLSSSGLSLLLNYSTKAHRVGKQFIIMGLNEDMRKLFTLTEIDRHITIVADLDEALKVKDKRSNP